MLHDCISAIYSSASDANNFDIRVFIDNNQINLYKKVKSKFTDVTWQTIPQKNAYGLKHIYMPQFDYGINSGHYFIWMFADDVFGLPAGWDKEVCSKKKSFADDLFCLYTQSELHGRNVGVKAASYNIPHKRKCDVVPVQPSDWAMCHGLSELFPIFTHKWLFFMEEFYRTSDCPGGYDMVAAALLQHINSLYKYNRNVSTVLNGITCINHSTNHLLMQEKRVKHLTKYFGKVAKSMYKYVSSEAAK